MKYKLFVIDIDNTLLDFNKQASKKNLESINEGLEAGINVSLASGRPAIDVLYHAKMIGLENSYHVSDNGAGFFKGDNITIPKIIDNEYYKYIISSLLDNGFECGVYSSSTKDFVYDKNAKHIKQVLNEYFPVTKFRVDNIRNKENIHKISVLYNNDNELNFLKSLEKKDVMNGVIPARNIFEMIPYGVTKIDGTKNIAKKLNIDLREVVTIGDEENDISNVKYAGLGIAVNNAINELKEVADVVLDYSCNEDAIYHAVHKYILT